MRISFQLQVKSRTNSTNLILFSSLGSCISQAEQKSSVVLRPEERIMHGKTASSVRMRQLISSEERLCYVGLGHDYFPPADLIVSPDLLYIYLALPWTDLTKGKLAH